MQVPLPGIEPELKESMLPLHQRGRKKFGTFHWPTKTMSASRSALEPNWIGLDPVVKVEDPIQFLKTLVEEDPAHSLLTRGYAVIKLPNNLKESYAKFAIALDEFCKKPLSQKAEYATKYDNSVYTPNQFHGYSRMEGLKEQYMIRASGNGTKLLFPNLDKSQNFGTLSLQLFEDLDQTCRHTLHQVCDLLGLPHSKADALIDPINKIGAKEFSHTDSDTKTFCSTSYMIDNYVSTSLLDVFRYENSFKHSDGSYDKFKNNHASHTDSGILTLVPVTDIPGLEVLDQSLNHWISLEKIIHSATENIRDYGTIFWGDSVEYLTKKAKASLHRVEKADEVRYSIVFKMRTTSTVTAPRYQEDYELASIQLKAMDVWKKTHNNDAKYYLTIASFALFLFYIHYKKNNQLI